MGDQDLSVVYTCGICETIVGGDYTNHSCLEGYNKIYVDDNHYFYPLLDDEKTVIRRSACLNGNEQLVYDTITDNNISDNPTCLEQTKKRKKAQLHNRVEKQRKLNDDEVEMLLMEVERRVPLWNFEIPIEERSREKVADLWQEVSESLSGVISAENAKKKFKSLRDTYRKIIRAEHRSSGSARVDCKDQWKFYRCCEYLRDSCLLKPTSSNVGEESSNEGDESVPINDFGSSTDETYTDIAEQRSSTPGSSRLNKSNRRKASESQESSSLQALNRIADIMTKDTQQLVLPEKPVMDSIDYLLSGAAEQIRTLPESIYFDVCMQVLNLIYNLGQNYTSEN